MVKKPDIAMTHVANGHWVFLHLRKLVCCRPSSFTFKLALLTVGVFLMTYMRLDTSSKQNFEMKQIAVPVKTVAVETKLQSYIPRFTPLPKQPDVTYVDISLLRTVSKKNIWIADLLDVVSLNGIFNTRQCSHVFRVDIGTMASATYTRNGKLVVNDSMAIVSFQGDISYTDTESHKAAARRHTTMQFMAQLFQLPFIWNKPLSVETSMGRLIHEELDPYAFGMSKACKKVVDGVSRLELYSLPTSDTVLDVTSHYVYLYLGQCALPYSEMLADMSVPRMESVMNCMTSEQRWSNVSSASSQTILDRLTEDLFSEDVLCKMQQALLDLLTNADDPSSTVESIGAQIVRFWESNTNKVWQKTVRHFAEEVDGKVSKLVRAYYMTCMSGDPFDHMLENPMRLSMRDEQITQLRIIRRHATKYFFLATFANGYKALGKAMHGECKRTDIGEGLAELLTFYTDRALMLNRFPHVVPRRLFFSSLKIGSMFIWPKDGKMKFTFNMTTSMKDYFEKYVLSNSKGPYLDVVFIGILKGVVPHRETQEIIDTLIYNATYASMTQFTMQTLRDVTDTIILDFLTSNFDRQGDNVVESELRIIPFDGGHGFRLSGPKQDDMVCDWLIERPHMLYNYSVKKDPKQPDLPVSCKSVPGNQHLCKFSRDTVELMRSRGSLIADLAKQTLQTEAADPAGCRGLEHNKVFSGIAVRVQYLLEYIDECRHKWGNKMYIE